MVSVCGNPPFFYSFVFELKMAVRSTSGENIPENCIGLTKQDAVNIQYKTMEALCPLEKRFFVTYGPHMAAIASLLSCSSISNIAIRISGAFKRIRITMSVPFVLVPAAFNMGLHARDIRDNIIIEKWACPVCYHIRSSLFQLISGVIYPTIFGGYFAFACARRFKIEGIPPLNHGKEIIQCIRTRAQPVMRTIKIYALLSIFLGILLPEMQAKETNFFNLNYQKLVDEFKETTNETTEANF